MATISKLPSGSWRVQVRRKGHYISESFLRRGDAELWARTVEGKIDRGEPIHTRVAAAKTFGDLIDLHRADLADVGRTLGRSKAASLDFLALRLGALKPAELGREKLVEFGRQRAKEGAGPVTVGIDLGYIKTILRMLPPFTASSHQPKESISLGLRSPGSDWWAKATNGIVGRAKRRSTRS